MKTPSPEKQLAGFIAKFTPEVAAHGLLRGSGNVVHNIRLESAATLDRTEVRALIKTALERAKSPIPPKGVHQLIIRSVSANQRPRRPAVTTSRTRNRSRPAGKARARR